MSGCLLNEFEILERLARSADDPLRVTISPIISLRHQLGSASMDLRIGPTFYVTRQQQLPFLDPIKSQGELQRDATKYMERVDVSPKPLEGMFLLHPGEFALASTLEYVKLPNDIACRLDGRSSWGRVGLQVHSTAGFVEPGFSGTVVFELSNVGKLPIELHVGFRLAQLTFYSISETSMPYRQKPMAKYGSQVGTAISAYYNDPEIRALFRLKDKSSNVQSNEL